MAGDGGSPLISVLDGRRYSAIGGRMQRAATAYVALGALSLLTQACLAARNPLDSKPTVARDSTLLGEWRCTLSIPGDPTSSNTAMVVTPDGKDGYLIAVDESAETYKAFGSTTPAGVLLNVTPFDEDLPASGGWLFAKYERSSPSEVRVSILDEHLMGGSPGEGWSEGIALTEDSPEVIKAKMRTHKASPLLFKTLLTCKRPVEPPS